MTLRSSVNFYCRKMAQPRFRKVCRRPGKKVSEFQAVTRGHVHRRGKAKSSGVSCRTLSERRAKRSGARSGTEPHETKAKIGFS